jgi:hypothetical protein
MISDKNIKEFFQWQILKLDEDDVDIFLNNYSSEAVINCLLDELKSLPQEGGEWAWKLGRVFGSISKKYCADSNTYSFLNSSDLRIKKILLSFLSGYWDNAEANLEIIVKIAKEIVDLIENHDNSQWDTWAITLAIEAVAVGYFNNKNLFKVPEKSNLERVLTIFKAYVSDMSPKSSAYQLLSNFE